MTKTDETSKALDVRRFGDTAVGIMDNLGIRLADPLEIQWEIAERQALAATPEELFNDSGPLGLREHLGEPFLVKRVRWLPSAQPDGPGFYALINAVTPDEQQSLVFTTGALSVLIQLARAAQMDWLDKPVMAKESDQPTADGYRPYRLVFS